MKKLLLIIIRKNHGNRTFFLKKKLKILIQRFYFLDLNILMFQFLLLNVNNFKLENTFTSLFFNVKTKIKLSVQEKYCDV